MIGDAATNPADLTAALTRSSVLWVEVPGGRHQVAWFARAGDRENTCYLISGAGEQEVADLAATTSVILRRRDSRTPVGPLSAYAETVAPDDSRWSSAVADLMAARQGVPSDELRQRWRAEGTVWAIRLQPDEQQITAG